MKVSSISAAALAVLVSGTLGCSADRISSPQAGTLSPGTAAFGAVDQNESSTYTWHVNGTVTEASNGDRVALTGTGPLGIHPKSASGGGTFEHTNAQGTVIGSGTWTVTELLSFQSYGAAPPPSAAPRCSSKPRDVLPGKRRTAGSIRRCQSTLSRQQNRRFGNEAPVAVSGISLRVLYSS